MFKGIIIMLLAILVGLVASISADIHTIASFIPHIELTP